MKTEEVCLVAVREYGLALEFVPRAVKTPKVFLEAVKQDGRTQRWVPVALKTEEVCLEAVRQCARGLPRARAPGDTGRLL